MNFHIYSIRSYASIDHFCPLIYDNLKNKEIVYILINNPLFNINSHLAFNKIYNKNNIKVIYFWKYYNFFFKLFISLNLFLKKIPLKILLLEIIKFKITNFFEKIILIINKNNKFFFLNKILKLIENEINSQIFSNKYFYIDSDSSKITKSINNFLKTKNFLSISYPHGLNICSNELRTINHLEFNEFIDSGKSFDFCDFIIYHNKLDINKIPEKEKINYPFHKYKYAKSERFTYKWLEHLSKIDNFNIPSTNINKINICLIFPKLLNGVFYEELYRCIKILSNYDTYNIIIKIPFKNIDKRVYNLKKLKLQNVYFDSKNLTSNIINISEIVIFIDANVVIDAFILNKKIVALDYIYMNTLYFNNFDEINFIRNRDEFYELFKPSNIKNIKKIGNDSMSLNKILPFQNITLQSILNEK